MNTVLKTQRLDAALSKFLKEYEKQSGEAVAVVSNWEKGTIQIQVN